MLPRDEVKKPKTRGEEVRERAYRQFQDETKEHIITDMVDGAGFRRIFVQKPGTGICSFTITTWPHYLAVTGDIGAWVFTRVPDMFDFFRGPVHQINPGYWSE